MMTPSVEDVVQGLEDAERNLANFSVTSRVESLQMPWGREGKQETQRYVATYSVDSSDRSRYRLEQLDERGNVIKLAYEVFDGSEFRSATGVGTPQKAAVERLQTGRISGTKSDRSWLVDPWDMTTKFTGYPISDLIKAHQVEALEEAEWEGRSVLRLTTRPIQMGSGDALKGEYLIDPARGFAVVRKASLVRSKTDAKWFEFRKMEGRDYVEAGPGIWVPSRYLIEVFQPVSNNPVRSCETEPIS
jgi:hypothetical protein